MDRLLHKCVAVCFCHRNVLGGYYTRLWYEFWCHELGSAYAWRYYLLSSRQPMWLHWIRMGHGFCPELFGQLHWIWASVEVFRRGSMAGMCYDPCESHWN